MQYNNIEINVLVKGKPITEYAHNGQTYIEGRDGSNFEIRLKNHNAFRVEAIVSVDGLSVIDGKAAGEQSSGYLLEAGETLAIPGWKLNDAQVAAFAFTGRKGGSYAEQSTGSARNSGVIGVMTFKEKVPERIYHTCGGLLGGFPGVVSGGPLLGGGVLGGPTSAGWNSLASYNATSTFADTISAIGHEGVACANTVIMAMADVEPTATLSSHSTGSVRRGTFAPDRVSKGFERRRLNPATQTQAPAVSQTLGTAFGSAQDFATQTVDFTRGDLLAVTVMYYDDRRGLVARGVPVNRVTARRQTQAPQAFPAQGCVPPAGWRG